LGFVQKSQKILENIIPAAWCPVGFATRAPAGMISVKTRVYWVETLLLKQTAQVKKMDPGVRLETFLLYLRLLGCYE